MTAIYRGKIKMTKDMKNINDSNKALSDRIDRFIDLGIISISKGSRDQEQYKCNKNFAFYLFYVAARIIYFFRRLLAME
ncbi:MAG: hypothetical protein HQK49_14095 [Oligoflexia bacterium]|nr:hypothetical protein [Oligoflexia bacterium]